MSASFARRLPVVAPSPALLRFLRHQAGTRHRRPPSHKPRPMSPSCISATTRCLRQHGTFPTARGAASSSSSSASAAPRSIFLHSSGSRSSAETHHASSSVAYLRDASLGARGYATRTPALLNSPARPGDTDTREGGQIEEGMGPLFGNSNGGSGGGGFAPGVLRGPSRMKELKLRCTEFNEKGTVTLVSAEFQKQQLIAKYGLLPRDLRKIDSSILPHIVVRPTAILVNLLNLRVLIMHNRVLVFDAFGSTNSFNQSVFIYDLEHRLAQRSEGNSSASNTNRADHSDPYSQYNQAPLPYEFRALEAVLVSVTNGLEHEFEGVRAPVVSVLRELEEDIDRDRLRHLLVWSKKLGTFEQKARLVRDALEELLEADDDLAAMYLTEKAGGAQRAEDEHTEVEMLLESYHKVADEIVQAAENLVSNIRNTEEIVKAILDANRNSLMLLDLKFSVGTLGLGAGTFVAALYGMNLKNFAEESDLGFAAVSAACAAFTAVVFVTAFKRLRKVQRRSMWGEPAAAHHQRRRSWMSLGFPGGRHQQQHHQNQHQQWQQHLQLHQRQWASGQSAGVDPFASRGEGFLGLDDEGAQGSPSSSAAGVSQRQKRSKAALWSRWAEKKHR